MYSLQNLIIIQFIYLEYFYHKINIYHVNSRAKILVTSKVSS